MRDPFPIPPPRFIVSATKPFADALNLHTLPLHAHEVLFAAALYTFVEKIVSPWISNLIFPKHYARLSRRARLNWDVHVVSFFQACLINALSLYIIWFDEERKAWRDPDKADERIWAYYGSGGMAQSFALGYFLWDLYFCSMHTELAGWGMLAHAISAVAVFALGYRPFIYFYAPVFLLYELSSPFLNIHWFCDKLDLTGSTIQAVNGAFLVTTFFGCRLVWGLYSSYWVFRDVLHIIAAGKTNYSRTVPLGRMQTLTTSELLAYSRHPQGQINAFNREQYLPIWIPAIYLASNLVLNSLNVFWFGKMIETIRTRFDPPLGTKGLDADGKASALDGKAGRPRARSISQLTMEGATVEEDVDLQVDGDVPTPPVKHAAPAHPHTPKKKGGSVSAARAKAEEALNGPVGIVRDTKMERPVTDDVALDADVTGSARKGGARSRRKA